MQTEDFKRSIQLAETRESIMGSALARHYKASLCFVDDSERRREYDYSLYSSQIGYLYRIEQQDDYFITDMDSTLCIELFTFTKDGRKNGTLYYTKADKLCYVLNNLKKVILLDVKVLKQFIISLEHENLLQVFEPTDHDQWKQQHNTNPTSCAILPIRETLLHDPKSRVLSFQELNIPSNYGQLQFKRNNND